MSRRNAKDWRKAVFSSAAKWQTKVGLLYLADFMKIDNRHVSRPRELMAKDLGVSARSVDRMIRDAHEVGLLHTVAHGKKGVTAVYQGLFPTLSATRVVALKRAESVALKPGICPVSATTVGAPVVREPTSASCENCAGWGCETCAE